MTAATSGRFEVRASRDQRTQRQMRAAWVFFAAYVVPSLLIALVAGLAQSIWVLVAYASALVVILPLAALWAIRRVKRARIVVVGEAITSVGPFRRSVVARGYVRAMRLVSGTSFGGRLRHVSGPLLLLLDDRGHCVRRINAVRFSEDDVRRLALQLGIPVSGSYGEIRTFKELNAGHPGAANWIERQSSRVLAWTVASAVLILTLLLGILFGVLLERGAAPASARLPTSGNTDVATATDVSPIVPLQEGLYIGAFSTQQACAVRFTLRRDPRFPQGAAPGNVEVTEPGRLASSGILYVTVTQPSGTGLYDVAIEGSCPTWSLTLAHLSSTPRAP